MGWSHHRSWGGSSQAHSDSRSRGEEGRVSDAPPQSWAFSWKAREVRGIRREVALQTQGPACTAWVYTDKSLGDGKVSERRNLPFFELLGIVGTACLNL